MMSGIDERRLRFYRISESQALYLFQSWSDWPDLMYGGKVSGPPDGSCLVGVFGDHAGKTIKVMVYHPSFEVVPDCSEIPFAGEAAEVELQIILRQRDGSYRLDTDPLNDPKPPGIWMDGKSLEESDDETLSRMMDRIHEILRGRGEGGT